MKISASIYSNPSKSLRDIVYELDSYHVDFLHVDCNDDPGVFDDIKAVREISMTPIDLHIITDNPENYYQGIIDNKVEFVCFQYENLKRPLEIPEAIDARLGIALMNDTPVEAMSPFFENNFSFGLLMTTTPGKSGGAFNEDTYERIKEFKRIFPSKAVHVDGGVNDTIAGKLRGLGVDCSISGSYLLKADEVGIALARLKSDLNRLDFQVTEFMLRLNQIPVLLESELSLEKVITTISKYKMAFCIIVDNDKKLKGIITDGDLRNELLNNITDLNKVSVNKMINSAPLTIKSNSTVTDAFYLIKKYNRQITFLPVVNEQQALQGVVSISQLIKGNL